ncbi:nuclear transport factor 2 family protein [Arthrobacter sp. 2MCAF15]|uniref:nuclear transport factor 2 family protein n=1 Tax=Arthrobacter sp. 2MCAF15 TaxID=3232984 RepID=UPI003F8F83CC
MSDNVNSPGHQHDPETAAAILACGDAIVAFNDFLDEGDIEAAYQLHEEALKFWVPGAEEPRTGRDEAKNAAAAFRFSYPGRRTLHSVSNLRVEPSGQGTMAARYLTTVYELTTGESGVAVELEAPVIYALAREHTRLRQDQAGRWKIYEQRMQLIAPLSLRAPVAS